VSFVPTNTELDGLVISGYVSNLVIVM